jgi:hypothetical protein
MNNPTPNPQETVCPKAHCKCMYGEARGCKNHHYSQCVVQTPQENNPGFTAVVQKALVDFHELEAEGNFGWDDPYLIDDRIALVAKIEAAHQKEIQAAKRETLEYFAQFAVDDIQETGLARDLQIGRNTLANQAKRMIKELEEETTS